jgi:hypothetical protein
VSLFSLPIAVARLALQVATLPARATARTTAIVAEQVVEALEHRRHADEPDWSYEPAAPASDGHAEEGEEIAPVRPPIADRDAAGDSIPDLAPSREDLLSPEPPAPALSPEPPSPSHVDTEPELVAEFADAGAADGAGAEVRVDPPWPRYSRMPAAAVVDRLPAEPETVISVLLLYERSHRNRRSVIEGAERELKRRSNSSG